MNFNIGDWVYCQDENAYFKIKRKQFARRGIDSLENENGGGFRSDCCVKLTPLTLTDTVVAGDEVICINAEGVFWLQEGEKYRIDFIDVNGDLSLTGTSIWRRGRFARIPDIEHQKKKEKATRLEIERQQNSYTDYPQWKAVVPGQGREIKAAILAMDNGPVDLGIPPATPANLRCNIAPLQVSIPCPHPEWCGIWEYCGDVYKITWQGDCYVREKLAPLYSECIQKGSSQPPNGYFLEAYLTKEWSGPGEFWKMIEPESNEARAHPPQKNPGVPGKAHRDYIKTPLDPWE